LNGWEVSPVSTVGDELPDASWSEEKLLESLKKYAISSSVEDHDRRRVCLDELRRRKTIKQVDGVVEILLDYTKKYGMSDPESSLIIELLSKLANSEEIAFKKWLDSMIVSKDNGSSYCFARIVPNLDDTKKKICVLPLLSSLMSCGSFTGITSEMCQSLINIDNKDIQKDIVKATLPYLKMPDTFKVVYAVKIISSLSPADLIPELELVIERTLTGWHKAYEGQILTDICNYYRRTKDERSIPHLLKILKSGFDREERVASKALASVIDANPNSITEIWRFLQTERNHHSPILMALSQMESSVDVEKLFSVLEIDLAQLLHLQLPRQYLKEIVIRAGKQTEQFLLKMVKHQEEVRYTFASECLEEIGVSFEEYSKVFDRPPVLQVYEFFFEKMPTMLLENLLKAQETLGGPIKRAPIRKSDYFSLVLFSVAGFTTLFVDPADREGVDIIAFAPNEPYILVIGCTTGILSYDLQKLTLTLEKMENALKDLLSRYRVLPMVITFKGLEVSPNDFEIASRNRIAILTSKELESLLRMLKANRGSKEIIKQIKQWVPPMVV
jgi:hypothetical protein